MPLASIVTCLFLGWYVPKKIVRDEFTNWGTVSGRLFPVFLFMIRFVSLICILAYLPPSVWSNLEDMER